MRGPWKNGQSTVEYILMVVVGAILAIQVARFFTDVFNDGLRGLEGTIEEETATGQGFTK